MSIKISNIDRGIYTWHSRYEPFYLCYVMDGHIIKDISIGKMTLQIKKMRFYNA